MLSNTHSAVEVEGLWVVRGRRAILQAVDLTVTAGETIALVSPNGAGKSTLLKCLAGALRPSQGVIRRFGKAVATSAAARRQVGFVGHEPALYGELTALENLVFAGRMCGVDCPSQRAHALLAESGIERMAYRPAGQLSQGARQRLAICRALVHAPPLILLDEPFASLDAEGRQWLEGAMRAWQMQERAICFASHDIDQCGRLAHRIIRLATGCIASVERTHRTASHSRQAA
jgi:heme exporter protein A